MKKNTVLLLTACLMLSGCGWVQRVGAYTKGYEKTCIDGVLYYQFPSGATVAYEQNGNVKTCK